MFFGRKLRWLKGLVGLNGGHDTNDGEEKGEEFHIYILNDYKLNDIWDFL